LSQDRAVIFDMDGVLILSEEAHWESWCAPAAKRGVKLDYDRFLSCFGRINPDCIKILFGPDLPSREVLRIADEKETAFRDIIRRHVPLAPGTRELLTALHNNEFRLAIGSSGPRENVELVLDAAKLGDYFDAYVHGGEVPRGKPAPDVFLLAAQRLEVPPRFCAVIEDAPAGIQAAVAARMLPIALTTTHKSQELKDAGAEIIYDDLSAIPPKPFIKMMEDLGS
jgi:beta-phosphoglucomutase